MSKKSKPATAGPTEIKLVLQGDEADRAKLIAQAAIRPSVQAALTVKTFSKVAGDLDFGQLVEQLGEQAKAIKGGSMERPEAMLITHAHTLDTLFNELARRAAGNMGHYPETVERYMRLALKCQSQCRTTIETLADIKNPRPVAFVKQANIANNQQINNGAQPPGALMDQYAQAHAGAREIKNQPNELLEAQHGKRLDTGTAGQAIGGNSAMEAVGAVYGAEDTGG